MWLFWQLLDVMRRLNPHQASLNESRTFFNPNVTKWESFSYQLACFVLLYLSPLLIYFISVSGFGIFEKYGKVGRFVRHKSHDKILMEWNPSGNECCLGIKGFLIPWRGHSVTALCSWSAHWWQHFRHKRRLWWRGTSPLFYFSIPH